MRRLASRLTIYPLALLALLGPLPGCQAQEAAPPADPQERVPAVDVAAEQALIMELEEEWTAMANEYDYEGIATMHTADGRTIPPGAAPAVGRPAIEETWRQIGDAPGILTREPSEIVISAAGDLAYETGKYRTVEQGPDGPVERTGEYLVVWRKVAGRWKAAVDMFNSDRPAR